MKAVTLFGKMLTFSRLKITTNNFDDIKAELIALTKQNAGPIPVVLDSSVHIDLGQLIDMLWPMGIHPIGVVSGLLSEQAEDLRLATFPADGKRIERLVASETVVTKAEPVDRGDTPVQAVASQTLTSPVQPQLDMGLELQGVTSYIHNQMIRSGQSLQHLGGDLIVVGGVNDSAEAITDGSLHVYGRGQGRLVAGATGDKDARIFCQRFSPSLVSVAGTYCLREAIPEEMIEQPVQVSYDEQNGLVFTLIPAP